MKINYNYKTYEDRLREQYQAYNQVIEKRATKSILSTAVDLFDQQQYDLCLKISDELEKTATTEKDLYDAKKLIALCHYAKHDTANSDAAFYDLTRNSKNSDDWFNATIAAALNENYERSEELFDEAFKVHSEFGTAKNMPPVQLIFHYMLTLQQNEVTELAYDKFNMLRQVYEQLKSNSDQDLTSKGLYPISEFLEHARETLIKSDQKDVKKMLDKFKTKVNERNALVISNFQDTL